MKSFKANIILIGILLIHSSNLFSQSDIQVEKIIKTVGSYKDFCVLAKFDNVQWNKEIEEEFIIALSKIKHITVRKGTPLFPRAKNYTMEQINNRLKKIEIFGLIVIHFENDTNDISRMNLITELIETRTGQSVWKGKKSIDAVLIEQSDYKTIFNDYSLTMIGYLWQDKMIYDCGCK